MTKVFLSSGPQQVHAQAPSPPNSPEETTTRRKRRPWGPLLAVLLVLVAMGGWFWWQQTGLSTETIAVSGAPAAFDGFRIAVISDLHGKEFGPGNERLLDYVRGLDPDLIAITGDLIHAPAQMAMVPALVKGLAAIAPTYYVTGNHEWAARIVPELEALLTDCGVTVLSDRYTLLERGDETLALLGVEDGSASSCRESVLRLAEEVRADQGEDSYTLLLCHRNTHYEIYGSAKIDLTLSGHAHGGLIRLPGTDGFIGPLRDFWPDYTAGLYSLSTGQMVVSRGLGNQFPAFRLFNRPDVPLVLLHSGA